MLKNTIRLIMFLECNFKCRYCCNDKTQFNQLFEEKNLSEVDWNNYQTVCITGGEPFARKDVLYAVMDVVPSTKPIFLYTNGFLINDQDIIFLRQYENLKGINVGVHGVNQVKFINSKIDRYFSVRYQAQDSNREKFFAAYPDRLHEGNTKFWRMDDCYRDNEDWVLLRDFENGYGNRLSLENILPLDKTA